MSVQPLSTLLERATRLRGYRASDMRDILDSVYPDQVLLGGTHANRPAANTVPPGTLYSCTDDDLVYQSDGSTWSTWATVGGGGGGATELIDSEVLASAASSVTFSPIPGSYNHLLLKGIARSDAQQGNTGLRVNFNNDTGTNYGRMRTEGQLDSSDNPTVLAGGDALGDSSMAVGVLPADDAPAGAFSGFDININSYAGTTFWKEARLLGGVYTGEAARAIRTISGWGMWTSTSAITRIDLDPGVGDFVAGSSFYLYGIT